MMNRNDLLRGGNSPRVTCYYCAWSMLAMVEARPRYVDIVFFFLSRYIFLFFVSCMKELRKHVHTFMWFTCLL